MTATDNSGTDRAGFEIREASRDDIPQLEELVDHFVAANRLLPRTFDGHIVGFAALEIYSAKLAEIRSLAVHESHQGKGIGRGLVHRCVDLARHRNVLEVMAVTSADVFFLECGFDFTLPGEKKALFMQTRDKY
jgi:amino-acid N-acetyltransferase